MQINKIQVKRGAGKPNDSVLDNGELGYDTINKELYVGNTTADGDAAAPTLINSVKSVNNKTGAVNLSASDVGARPNTWTPTAADVGARPDNWMPTIADIGAAPSGYGYGEVPVNLGSTTDDAAFVATLTEQFNSIAGKSMLVRFTHGGGAFTATLWNAGNNYGTLVASSYAEPNVGYRFKQLVRICTNGTWGAWVDNSPTAFAPTSHKHDFLADVGSSSYRPGMQYSGSPTNPTYVAVWEYNQSANGTQPNVLVRAIEAEKARALIGAVGYKLLWTNASPTSSFEAQTISLDLSGYQAVLIYFNTYTGSAAYAGYYSSTIAKVGQAGVQSDNGETGSYMTNRGFIVNTNGIEFKLAYYAGSYGTKSVSWSSNCLVPCEIYGIKGVS